MSWSLAMSDLSSSWPVGIAFLVLVAVRLLLTSRAALLENARASGLGGTAEATPERCDAQPAPAAAAPEDAAAPALLAADAEQSGAPVAPAESMRRSVLEFVDSGLIALVLVFLVVRPFVVQAFYIPSPSMRPTLMENDKILVSKFIYRFHKPQRGDVVVFKAPRNADAEEKDFIKRLVGLPGDTVAVRGGVVFVNGEPLREDYIAEPPARPMDPVLVEPGRVFVMGDNRNDSNDSRVWGLYGSDQLEGKRIRGKAVLIFWPPHRIGLIR